MLLRQIFDDKLAQYAYLIGCQRTGEALIIDPERDVDRYIELAKAEGLHITAVAETHIHADFLSGARELAERLGSHLYLSDEGDADWKYEWIRQARSDGGAYAVTLLHHRDRFNVGNIEIQAIHTPGHTPEHLSYLVTDHGSGAPVPMGLASGDFVFVGDLGRPDLLESAAGVAGQMEPSARSLFHSLDRFLELPDYLQVWPAHGAGSACGKALGAVPTSTVGYEKQTNPAIDARHGGEDAFVEAILEGQPEPPVYFATMKKLNKLGAPVLGTLPQPRPWHAEDMALWLEGWQADAPESKQRVVIDTRCDREAFMAGHLEGSLFAPLDRTFPTTVGSYVEPDQDIVLVVEEGRLDEAVRDLVRIGFDNIVAFASPEILAAPVLAPHLKTLEVLDFEQLRSRRKDEGVTVLDVRRATEFAAAALDGALNIAHTRLLRRLDEIPKDKDLLVHCRTGARAATAVAMLRRHGRKAWLVDGELAAALGREV